MRVDGCAAATPCGVCRPPSLLTALAWCGSSIPGRWTPQRWRRGWRRFSLPEPPGARPLSPERPGGESNVVHEAPRPGRLGELTDLPDRLTTALADRYAIDGELGSGGMATVYLARDL